MSFTEKKGAAGPRLYKAAEFAERAGVTVRTLHHYDRLGLLAPRGRTEAGYRLYGEADLARLQQIATLKFIGLSLQQIKSILDRRTLNLAETLEMQRSVIQQRLTHLQHAMHALTQAEAALAKGEPDWDVLKKIMEVFQMQQNNDAANPEWVNRYYSPEAQSELAKRREQIGAAGMTEGEQAWKVLIADAEKAMAAGVSADSPEALALAKRWRGLIQSFTGGNPEIAVGLKKLYADQQNWPATFKKPYSDELGRFMCAAMEKLPK